MITMLLLLAITPELDLARPVVCVFQDAHMMTKDEAKSFKNSSPLVWKMSNLLSARAIVYDHIKPREFVGRHIINTEDGLRGVSIFVPQSNGANLVTVWSNGYAYWTKHNQVGDDVATQQFRGSCSNW
jgi:hypothetical protein